MRSIPFPASLQSQLPYPLPFIFVEHHSEWRALARTLKKHVGFFND